MADAVATF